MVTRIKAWMEKKRKEDALVAALTQGTQETVPVGIHTDQANACALLCLPLTLAPLSRAETFTVWSILVSYLSAGV